MKNLLSKVWPVIVLTAAEILTPAAQGKVSFPFVGDPSEPAKTIYAGNVKAGQDCLDSSPGNRVCLEIRGTGYYNLHDYPHALEDFTALIAGGQGTALQYFMRGAIYNATGDYEKALTDLNRADQMSPGQKPLLFVRGHVYLMLNKPEAALADLGPLPVGPWDNWVYYYRGLAFAAKKMDREAEADLAEAIRQNPKNAGAWQNHGLVLVRQGKTAKGKLELAKAASLDPALTRKQTATTAAETNAPVHQQPVKTAAKPPGLVPAAAAAWKRTTLKGTGVSLETPKDFSLLQETPDPLIEEQTAYVVWKLLEKEAFMTVVYEKNSARPTVRQKLEETAKFDAGSYKMLSAKITETTFAGQPAAVLEEEFYESNGQTPVKYFEFCFGAPGELTIFSAVYPSANAAARDVAMQIYKSLKKEGEAAAETPKMPPTDWHRAIFHGLSFETPLSAFDKSCAEQFSSRITDVACYRWGKYLTLNLSYRQYPTSAAAPSIAEMIAQRLESDKEVEKVTKSGDRVENTTEAFAIPGADAGKLKIETGFDTAGTHEEIIYVRRGTEIWEVRVYYFVRWQFDEEAAARIIKSLKDLPPAAAENRSSPVLTDSERYKQIGKDLSEGKNVSEEDIKWALQYEKNHPAGKIN